MKDIIELLDKTEIIYDRKLEKALTDLEEIDVKSEEFDKMLNTVSSLIALKIQNKRFKEENKEGEE